MGAPGAGQTGANFFAVAKFTVFKNQDTELKLCTWVNDSMGHILFV